MIRVDQLDGALFRCASFTGRQDHCPPCSGDSIALHHGRHRSDADVDRVFCGFRLRRQNDDGEQRGQRRDRIRRRLLASSVHLQWSSYLGRTIVRHALVAIVLNDRREFAILAAIRPQASPAATLRGMIPSWDTIVRGLETFDRAVNVVHRALRHYDLPDLAAMIGADRLKIVEPVDPANPSRKP